MGFAMVSGGKPDMAAPVSGILASDLAVGSSVYLMEDGVAVEYLVVNQGKPSGSSLYDDSCDGTWLLRKNLKRNYQWNSSRVNDYQNSTIHSWLNSDFFNQFGSVEQAAIKQVKIPYVNGTGVSAIASGENGLTTKVFLLSGYEVGWTQSTDVKFPIDGSCLSYFSGTSETDSKRIAGFSTTGGRWWLRSVFVGYTDKSWGVDVDGGIYATFSDNLISVRNAVVVLPTAIFDDDTLILKGVA